MPGLRWRALGGLASRSFGTPAAPRPSAAYPSAPHPIAAHPSAAYPSAQAAPAQAAPARLAVTRLAAAGAGLALLAALLAGCGEARASGPAITLLSGQVTEPNSDDITNAYVIVQNTGPAIQLIGARSSAGGTVALRSPARHGEMVMRTVSAITIPAHSLFRLDPSGSHLLITGSGPMKAGTEITLTLVFAHAGTFSVPAMVTNPQSGGSSYFLN
jgi:copper(I)-binding protein